MEEEVVLLVVVVVEEEESVIKDRMRQANSLSRGSVERASTQGWRRSPLPSNTAPPRNGLNHYSLGLC